PATMNTASPAQVSTAPPQVIGCTDWWIQNWRSSSANTISEISRGYTTDTSPSCSASAWNTNAAPSAIQPNSHSGLWNRYLTSRQPEECRGSAVLAMCWVVTLTALDSAVSKAKSTAMP